MTPEDKPNFAVLVTSVYAFYRQDCSDFAIGVWWEACKPFDFAAVRDALNRHCVNPDQGQFMPKPADIVKLLQGSSKDSALLAWAKVDRAVRQVGPYASVAFDDPIIHAVLQDMGGWAFLGGKDEKEWPFVKNEFEARYRGYKQQGAIQDFPKVLLGMYEAQNSQNGFRSQPPVLIGNADRAKQVMLRGSDKPSLGFTRMSAEEMLQLGAPHAQGEVA